MGRQEKWAGSLDEPAAERHCEPRASLALVATALVLAIAASCAVGPRRCRLMPSVDPDLELAAAWLCGIFDDFAQAERDEAVGAPYKHLRVTLRICPVAAPGLAPLGKGRILYLEQASAQSPETPYRQRILLLTRRADGALVSRTYRFRDPGPFAGGWREPPLLLGLEPGGLILEEGCDMVWKRSAPDLIVGEAGAVGACRTAFAGANHVVSKVCLTPDAITTLDRGYDDGGIQKWGPPSGTEGYIFLLRERCQQFGGIVEGN